MRTLSGAVEALRRAEAGGVTEGVRAATIRGALRLQRKVRRGGGCLADGRLEGGCQLMDTVPL